MRQTKAQVVGLIGGALVALVLVGCGRSGMANRTAVVTFDGVTHHYTLDSCGLDGTTVFVVGRGTNGDILQAVIGVKADHRTGIAASTGITAGRSGATVSAFGTESWARRQGTGRPPGHVNSAGVQGSRIQLSAAAEPVDDQGNVLSVSAARGSASPLTLDARCDR